jgi:erythromycin esterase-like protein
MRRALADARAAKLMLGQARTPAEASRAEERLAFAMDNLAKERDNLARHRHYFKTGRDTDFDSDAMTHQKYGSHMAHRHPLLQRLATTTNRSR